MTPVSELCASASAARNGLQWVVARDGVDLEADGAQLVVAEEDGLDTGAAVVVMMP